MRTEFKKSVRFAALKRCMRDGVPYCEGCGLSAERGVEYDHALADGLGGKATLENCLVLCIPCHKAKTHGHDRPIMQKADAQFKARFNVKNPPRLRGPKFQPRPKQRSASRPLTKQVWTTS